VERSGALDANHSVAFPVNPAGGILDREPRARAADRPLIGAQVWIEPGQTPPEIERWFEQLSDAHMPVVRLFLMWSYLEPAPDRWDFSLFDVARSAERHRKGGCHAHRQWGVGVSGEAMDLARDAPG
jgi:hypothetical protein